MRTFLLSIALGCSVAACAQSPLGPVSEPWFNAREFAGLVSTPAPDQAARLDFTLDGANGRKLHLTDCAQANHALGDDLAPLDHRVFQLLKLHCAAYERYQAAAGARRSYLPKTLDAAFIARLPEPILRGDDASASTTRIGDSPRVERVAPSGGGRWEIQTRTERVVVTRFAQGDFNHDGIDDMLLRVGWRVQGAFGGGVMIVEITRVAPDGRIEVVSRIRP